MTAPAPGARRAAELARAIPRWISRNLGAVVAGLAISSVVGYVLNVWLMAVRYEGSRTPKGAPVTSSGNLVSGGLFWLLATSVITGAIGYRRAIGRDRFWSEVRTLPATLLTLFRSEGRGGWVHLLWGAALALVASLVLSPAVGAVLGLGLVATAPSVIGRVLSGLVSQLWSVVSRPLQAARPMRPPGMLGSMVGILGGAVALVVGFVFSGGGVKVVAALVCAGAAVALGRQRTVPGAAVFVLLVGAAVLAGETLFVHRAAADDGGFAECGSSLGAWLKSSCAGGGTVRSLAVGGGVAAGLGGALGTAVGGVAGAAGGDGGPWWANEPAGQPGEEPGGGEPGGTALVDPTAGEPLPVSDGSDPNVPAGWVNVGGEWVPPETAVALLGEPPEPWVDPQTGEPLPVSDGSDPNVPAGWVDVGGEWLPPGEAAVLLGLTEDPWDNRYRGPGEVNVEGVRPARLDPNEGHELVPGEATGPDGEPLRDPRTGEPLPLDSENKVRYGDEWLSPEEAATRIAGDQRWIEAQAEGKDLVDRFKELAEQRANATEPAEIARLEGEMSRAAIEINENYAAKGILKAEGRSATAGAFDGAIQEIYKGVDDEFLKNLEAMGVTRGGQPMGPEDIFDIRNASSKGTAGMDRDNALNETEVRRLREELASAEPGSYEAQQLAVELLDAEARSRLQVDYGKYTDYLNRQLESAETPEARGRIQEEIARANADAARIKANYIEELEGALRSAEPGSERARQLGDELVAARERPAGREVVDVSPSKWNDMAQGRYNEAYHAETGGDARAAFHGITQQYNPEAYRNLAVLANDPRNVPFNPADAAQTASVSTVKTFHNEELAREGVITPGQALQENARGYAKDLNSKTVPLLQSDPTVDPAKLGRIEAIAETMGRIGRGEVLPGQADGALRVATGDPAMTMERAMNIADANLEAGIKMRPADTGSTLAHDAFGRVTDLATFEGFTQENMRQGMGAGEAMALAGAQTVTGNAAVASGISDPRLAMVGGALLPQGVNNVMPDQMASNTVATGWSAARAAAADIGTSLGGGAVDTTNIDKFAQGVLDRPGADPFKGYGEAAQLAGEELARTDGGNLATDLHQILSTGAGSEVAMESATAFQQEVAAGQHGVVLGGLDSVAGAVAELVTDPGTTVGQFVDDVKSIYNQGVLGDSGYWSEALDHTRDVIAKTPVLGTVASGYQQLAEGIGEQGVVGFGQEMYEGGAALAGEAVSTVADAASGAVDYVKSWFR